jgi:hypothetical protein
MGHLVRRYCSVWITAMDAVCGELKKRRTLLLKGTDDFAKYQAILSFTQVFCSNVVILRMWLLHRYSRAAWAFALSSCSVLNFYFYELSW